MISLKKLKGTQQFSLFFFVTGGEHKSLSGIKAWACYKSLA